MKHLLTLVAIIASLSVARSQTAKPAMTFESEIYDYGTITNNHDGNCVFTFTNTGSAPLIISNAKGSCNCTVPAWPKEPIAPGQNGEIKVNYKTSRLGPINKAVYITSNAGDYTLRIKGKVEAASSAPTKKKSGPQATN